MTCIDTHVAQRMREARRPIVVATHPRSGTHLMIDALRWRCGDCRLWKLPREPLERLYLTVDQLAIGSPRRSKMAALSTLVRVRRPLVKTHRLPRLERWLMPPRHQALHRAVNAWLQRSGSFVYVYRDGRESVWSYYLLARHSGALSGVNFTDFLRRASPTSPWGGAARSWAMHVRAWRRETGVLNIDYADLLATPEPVLQRVANHVGIELEARVPPLPGLRCPWESERAHALAGHPASTAVLGPDPVRPARTWRDVFSREDGRIFEQESEGLLKELAYEESGEWWMELL